MLVRNEVTKGYAYSEPDVYRRHGSSMYTGFIMKTVFNVYGKWISSDTGQLDSVS